MKFILILHASTEWDLVGRLKGQTDIPLNLQGRKEAKKLGSLVLTLGATRIVSSDLQRAAETAKIINSYLNIPLYLDSHLRECSFGRLEGLTKEEAIEKYGSTIIKQWNDQYESYDFRPFGGESRNNVLSRHLEIVDSLSKHNQNDIVLVVGHGRGLFTLLNGLGYLPDLKRGEYRIIDFPQQKP